MSTVEPSPETANAAPKSELGPDRSSEGASVVPRRDQGIDGDRERGSSVVDREHDAAVADCNARCETAPLRVDGREPPVLGDRRPVDRVHELDVTALEPGPERTDDANAEDERIPRRRFGSGGAASVKPCSTPARSSRYHSISDPRS